MAGWKILPAISAGNTIVIKPSELTPSTTLMLAEACTAAGIPDGVVNVVLGPGRSVGQSLVGHSDVNMVSFTGSTQVGVNVMRTAAERACRTHLELGGKAPFVVFDDADLEAAAQGRRRGYVDQYGSGLHRSDEGLRSAAALRQLCRPCADHHAVDQAR